MALSCKNNCTLFLIITICYFARADYNPILLSEEEKEIALSMHGNAAFVSI